jgi:cytochrome P450
VSIPFCSSFLGHGMKNVILINLILISDIYGHRSNVNKSKTYNVMVHRAPNTLTILDKKQHGRKKRVISQGFSDASLRALEPAILSHIQKFCSKLADSENDDGSPAIPDEWSPNRNMSNWCKWPPLRLR